MGVTLDSSPENKPLKLAIPPATTAKPSKKLKTLFGLSQTNLISLPCNFPTRTCTLPRVHLVTLLPDRWAQCVSIYHLRPSCKLLPNNDLVLHSVSLWASHALSYLGLLEVKPLTCAPAPRVHTYMQERKKEILSTGLSASAMGPRAVAGVSVRMGTTRQESHLHTETCTATYSTGATHTFMTY
jgi:hypothetical protein